MSNKTATFTKEVRTVLEENVLRYWLEKMADPLGGFFTSAKEDGTGDESADRSELISAGILYVFSAAYRKFKKKEYLITATKASDYFLNHFVDNKFGGVYFSLTPDGIRRDTKKHIKAQAAAIYGLTEYYAATGDDESIKTAENIYDLIVKEFAGPGKGEYKSVLTRDFKPVEGEAGENVNASLELAEAFGSLAAYSKKNDIAERTVDLLENIAEKGVCAECAMKASWIIVETAFKIGDYEAVNKVRPVARKLWEQGTCENAAGCAHCVIGNLYAWKYQAVDEGAELAFTAWEKVKGDTDSQHKRPFISARMCLEILACFDK